MKNFLLFSPILFIAVTVFAGNAIIGGTTVRKNDPIRKSVIALVTQTQEGESLCTASIVAADLAVTAAHCITSTKPVQKITLIFQPNIRKPKAEFMRIVDRAEVPSDWNPESSKPKDIGDVALVHFNGGLPEGYIASDLLPFDFKFRKGMKIVVAGYGISNAIEETGSGILRKTTVLMSNPNYSPTEVELDQSQGGAACHGDSGGPAFLMIDSHPYLFGITSRGSGNCDEQVIYSTIAAYENWFRRAGVILRR